jgi:hypothetical protein
LPETGKLPETDPFMQYNLWKGPNGLRPGWRLLIFVAILVLLGYGMSRSVDVLTRSMHADFSTPLDNVFLLDLLLLPLMIATWIMGRIEHRTFADYGLPWRRAFGRRFWQGACFSFVSFTVLLLVMRLAGVFSFGAIALHGWDVWKYAAAWAVLAFLSALPNCQMGCRTEPSHVSECCSGPGPKQPF